MGYKQAEKEIALGIIRRHGGLTRQAIDDARAALGKPGLSGSTLHGWLKADRQPITPADSADSGKAESQSRIEAEKRIEPVRAAAEQTLDNIFEQVARNYLTHALKDDVISDLKGKDAVIAAATAVDKMRLLRDLPTEIVDILPALLNAFKRRGMSPREMFLAMLSEAEAEILPAEILPGNHDLRQ